MKKIFLLFCLAFATSAWAQISDQQVLGMVRMMQSQGADSEEIAAVLVRNGATEEQLLRIKTQQERGAHTGTSTVNDSRLRTRPVTTMPKTAVDTMRRDSVLVPIEEEEKKKERPESLIFGHNIFNNRDLTFEPSLNIATPDNYVLGAGDEVIIDIWGNSQQTIRATISPDGSIVASPVGLVQLSGLSVAQANDRLRKAFSKVYALDGGGTQLNLSLGQIRSIQVHVMGEVVAPGTYTVPSLATLFHLLYSAGGVNEIGSLRDIRVNRGGSQVAVADVYDYLLNGRSDLDIALRDGDVIVVSPYANLVSVSGKVKRPMKYELKTGETLETLLDYTGGFTGDAYTKAVRIERKSGREYTVYNIEDKDFGDFLLTDCDSVSVDAVLDRFDNRVEVRGAVFRPGAYAIDSDMNTVSRLVQKAEGLRGDVFAGHAVLYRLKEDYTPEVVSINIGEVMAGRAEDVALRKDDVLDIASVFDLKENYTVSISGEIGLPGTYPFAENMSIEDFVIRAGGLLESASTVRIDVAQRIKDPESTKESNLKAVHLCFELKDGLLVGGDKDYVLRPFDAVYVRTSPGYSAQENVSITGQIMFGGEYALISHGERLSELVRKAGGLMENAYVSGARLSRIKTSEEQARENAALGLTRHTGRDSLRVEDIQESLHYDVGIELDKALQFPGSDFDLVLREGDRLHIPAYVGTVKISGAVIYPNTVAYRNGARLKHYIGQGGGFTARAAKRRAFVVHMNGTAERSRFLSKPKVTPGSLIIVPSKGEPRNRISAGEIVGLTTSVTSLGAIVTSLINMNK